MGIFGKKNQDGQDDEEEESRQATLEQAGEAEASCANCISDIDAALEGISEDDEEEAHLASIEAEEDALWAEKPKWKSYKAAGKTAEEYRVDTAAWNDRVEELYAKYPYYSGRCVC